MNRYMLLSLPMRRDGGLFRRPSPRRGMCSSACHATRWWTVPSSITAKRYMLLSLPRDAMVDCSVVRHREEVYAPQLAHATRWWTVPSSVTAKRYMLLSLPCDAMVDCPSSVTMPLCPALGRSRGASPVGPHRVRPSRRAGRMCSSPRRFPPMRSARRDGGLFRRPSPRRGICSSACSI